MNVNGMEISWGRILWCEDCEEIMKWKKAEGYWICPECRNLVFGKDIPIPDVDEN